MSCDSFLTSDVTSKKDIFLSEVLLQHDPADLPASNWFYYHYSPPKCGRSPAGPWSTVRGGVSQHSNQFLVPGRIVCGGRRVLIRAGLLLLLSVVMLPHRSG
jgi:hypothetical protein